MPTSHPPAGCPAVTQSGFGRSPALQHWAEVLAQLALLPFRAAGSACASPAGANLGHPPFSHSHQYCASSIVAQASAVSGTLNACL